MPPGDHWWGYYPGALLCSPWWRHQLEIFSALLALCARNSPVTGEFPTQRPVTRIFDVFFDLCLNKRLSKQSWGWWLETPSRSLWRYNKASLRNSFEGGRLPSVYWGHANEGWAHRQGLLLDHDKVNKESNDTWCKPHCKCFKNDFLSYINPFTFISPVSDTCTCSEMKSPDYKPRNCARLSIEKALDNGELWKSPLPMDTVSSIL